MRRRSPPRLPAGYDPAVFAPTAVTVDVVVLTVRDGRLEALLIERAEEPWKGSWALPGGFLRPGETLGEAAARELREETGVEAAPHLEQLGAFGDPGRDPRMRVVTVAFLAVLRSVGELRAGSDASRAELVPVESLLGSVPERELAFDHALILAEGVARAREKLASTSLATAFVGPEFTLADLRSVYEAAWGTALDPGNFRRKVLATEGFVAPTGRRAASGPEGGKPAETYRAGSRAQLHPPLLVPPPMALSMHVAESHVRLGRAAVRDTEVWRVRIGDDAGFQRKMLEAGEIAPVASGDSSISDDAWNAFLEEMRDGDLVLAPIAGDRVAIGRIRGPVRMRRDRRDRRLRRTRDVEWLAERERRALDEELRLRLDAPGDIDAVRVSLAALRVERLLGS